MPSLLTLRTDLKSLKYGSDGPYVEKDINNPPKYSALGLEATSRLDDLKRISKMLVDTPGLKFALHQAELNFISSDKKPFGKRLLGSLGNTAKVLASTVAQVPVNGTGTHFVIGFGGFEYLKMGGQRSTWLDRFLKTTLGTGGVNGAKSVLSGKPVILDNRGEAGFKPMIDTQFTEDIVSQDTRIVNIEASYTTKDGRNLARETGKVIVDNTGLEGYTPTNNGLDRTAQQTDVNIDTTYTGANGRVLVKGAAGTDIRPQIPVNNRAETPENIEAKLTSTDSAPEGITVNTHNKLSAPSKENKLEPYIKTGGGAPAEQPDTTSTLSAGQTTPTLTDGGGARQQEVSSTNIQSTLKPKKDYQKNSVGNPILRDYKEVNDGTTRRSSYSRTVDQKAQDQEADSRYVDKVAANTDMIPFVFTIFDTATVETGKSISFNAFLDSMDDNYTATWNGFNYIGRGEKFYTYGGFERKSTVSFKVAALTQASLRTQYEKVNLLASATAPTYDAGGSWMRGVFMRMTIGTYFNNQPALLNSVGISVDVNTPWEIDLDKSVGMEVPHVLNVSLDFTVLHDFTPKALLQTEYFGFRKAQ